MYEYDEYYYDYGYGEGSGIFGTIMLLIYLAVIIATVVAVWRIYKKANRPGWAAIVPFYNMYTLYDIVWGSGIKFLLLLIPIYNIILTIQTNLRLAKSFGKSTGFGIGLILIPPVFLMMLGFGKAEFVGVDGKEVQ